MGFLSSLVGPAIGAVGGLLGGSGQPDEITNTSEPWSGVQPYLTQGDGILRWNGPQPINLDWMRYNQAAAEGQDGSWLDTPPPMMMNDPRLTGENVYQPEDPGGILGVDSWGDRRPEGDAPVPTVDGIIGPQQPVVPGGQDGMVPWYGANPLSPFYKSGVPNSGRVEYIDEEEANKRQERLDSMAYWANTGDGKR